MIGVKRFYSAPAVFYCWQHGQYLIFAGAPFVGGWFRYGCGAQGQFIGSDYIV